MENEVVKALKEIIRKHTVRYEVWPHFEISEGKRVDHRLPGSRQVLADHQSVYESRFG